MAKFELKFLDALEENSFIQCNIAQSQSPNNWIEIKSWHDGVETVVWLDKSTAIKFAKTLRTEINKITESEGGLNG